MAEDASLVNVLGVSVLPFVTLPWQILGFSYDMLDGFQVIKSDCCQFFLFVCLFLTNRLRICNYSFTLLVNVALRFSFVSGAGECHSASSGKDVTRILGIPTDPPQ